MNHLIKSIGLNQAQTFIQFSLRLSVSKMCSTFSTLGLLLSCILVKGISALQERIKIGSIQTKSHGVRGDVYILDANTLEIKNFHYDGETFIFD